MRWNNHWKINTCHAILSPSKYHWINYSEAKLEEYWVKYVASTRGTRLHDLAKNMIQLRVKLPKTKKTLDSYVNDAIGFNMDVEIPLVYSENFFGTCDAIKYDPKKRHLRIHDLKTGIHPASFGQLDVYAALFCLEYDVDPNDIDIELRIYQNDEILIRDPEREQIKYIMQKGIDFNKRIEELKKLGGV